MGQATVEESGGKHGSLEIVDGLVNEFNNGSNFGLLSKSNGKRLLLQRN